MANIISSGCTVRNTFSVPVTQEETAVLYVTYQQGGETVIEKSLPDCTWSEAEKGAEIAVELSQEETLRLDPNAGVVRIQLRVRTTRGTAIKSNVMTSRTDELLKGGVI